MSDLLYYKYEGDSIAFTGDGYVDIFHLCDIYSNSARDFLELPQTKEFIAELARDTGLPPEGSIAHTSDALLPEFIILAGHGPKESMWVHPYLGMECARWLSPGLAIWITRVIGAILSGQPYHTADDKPLHKTMERGIEQTRETLQRKHNAYWHAMDVEGNVSIKAYILAAGLELTTQERMILGARVSYRSKLAGDPIGKIRQRRNRLSCRVSKGACHYGWHRVATFDAKHIHAELICLGFIHDVPTVEALAAAWEEYLPAPPKVGVSLYKDRGAAEPSMQSEENLPVQLL